MKVSHMPWSKSQRLRPIYLSRCQKYATAAVVRSKERPDVQGNAPQVYVQRQAEQVESDRAFFTGLLSSAASKRDAQAYLSRLNESKQTRPNKPRSPHVNLGRLYGKGRAAEQSPVFAHVEPAKSVLQDQEIIHVAIVKLAHVEESTHQLVHGLAETLSQLNRLSISPIVLIDHKDGNDLTSAAQTIDSITAAISDASGGMTRRCDNLFHLDSKTRVCISKSEPLMKILRRGQIPVVSTTAFDQTSQTISILDAAQAVRTLVRDLAGLNAVQASSYKQDGPGYWIQMRNEVSVDRLITIDKFGGVPRFGTAGQKHMFLNLEQEYYDLKDQMALPENHECSRNLGLLHDVLRELPPTSSGLMTTIEEAANLPVASAAAVAGVGTRRRKNALIHNLLTDKPIYSSSLPTGRLARDLPGSSGLSQTTLVKKGVPVSIFPNPRSHPWSPSERHLKLTDPEIDLARLVHLIEDSFGRKLNVRDYLERVNGKIAGVIVAGEYEGGALLTWETVPGSTISVPYLDKFAVLRKSQGAGGVADIVFNAMVRDCFPSGVCWRSRKDNPVNKWYFERSRGTWKIPDTNWTMFWTTPGVELDSGTFKAYEEVCRGVMPNWLDSKRPAD